MVLLPYGTSDVNHWNIKTSKEKVILLTKNKQIGEGLEKERNKFNKRETQKETVKVLGRPSPETIEDLTGCRLVRGLDC